MFVKATITFFKSKCLNYHTVSLISCLNFLCFSKICHFLFSSLIGLQHNWHIVCLCITSVDVRYTKGNWTPCTAQRLCGGTCVILSEHALWTFNSSVGVDSYRLVTELRICTVELSCGNWVMQQSNQHASWIPVTEVLSSCCFSKCNRRPLAEFAVPEH